MKPALPCIFIILLGTITHASCQSTLYPNDIPKNDTTSFDQNKFNKDHMLIDSARNSMLQAYFNQQKATNQNLMHIIKPDIHQLAPMPEMPIDERTHYTMNIKKYWLFRERHPQFYQNKKPQDFHPEQYLDKRGK